MRLTKWIDVRRNTMALAAAAVVALGGATPAAAQQDLYWGPGEDTAVVKGSVTGNQSADYSFSVKGGTELDVQLNSAEMGLYFNIIEANSSVAIEADPRPVEVRSWNGTIPSAGKYRIRLYMRGAAKDEGKTAQFTLTVKKTKSVGGGGGAGEDWYTITQIDHTTDGTGKNFVDNGNPASTITNMRVLLQEDGRARIEVNFGGDGFIIHGTWDHGEGPEMKVTITHGYSRDQLKGGGTITLRNRTEFDHLDLRFAFPAQGTNHHITFTAARG